MPKTITIMRRRLAKATRSKSKFIRNEARIFRAFINEPTHERRFSGGGPFNKPLIDDPNQLTRKRIRPFPIIIPGGAVGIVNLRRKTNKR